MGKYMRKSKTTGDVAVMYLPLGVRTRAKTLALQRRSPPYLLRSRLRAKGALSPIPSLAKADRAEKPPLRPRGKCGPGPADGRDVEEAKRESDGPGQGKDLGVEGSVGENGLESDSRESGTRESTPSNWVRDPESIKTPGSTTRPTSSADAERRSQSQRSIPSTAILDGLFGKAEEEQRQTFIQKYNFDPLEEKPLSGRFEWEEVEP